jgi:Zn-dependent membrane protease YugP
MYVIGRRRPPSVRFHAAMALNLSLTGLLYGVCCLILFGMLLLDTLTVALVVTIPVGFGIWLSVVKYLIRGIGAANRGERYDVPAWICARMVKP